MESNLLAEMQTDGFRGKRTATTRGGEWHGPCILPGCGGLGKDRLRVQPYAGKHGYFECRVCGAKGSLVDYLMIKRGYTKQYALSEVGWKPQDGSTPRVLIPKEALSPKTYPTHAVPSPQWQTTAKAFLQYCADILWGGKGQEALDYLRSRGLKDNTIKAAGLGYNPAEMLRPGAKWGREKSVTLCQGIVIPWFLGEDLWRITVRDEKVVEGDNRYKQVPGGSNGLYFGYTLGYERPVVLVEGEFDALSIAQEAGHAVSVVATGGTAGSRITKWLAALATKDLVLVAFDAEERGDSAAQWWLDRLENAHRLRPFWKDANQMLQDNVALLDDWITPRVESILHGSSVIPAPSADVCKGCGCPFPSFEGWDIEKIPTYDVMAIEPVEGDMYCEKCRPDLFEQLRELARAS
ncbi:MAG: hypothetical protein AUH05_06530 [Ktedonobacter sp. 13_2_20CM_53_11]|nr:MAG: hypothetical protein AUH05_06530 [Ktedonobacter sp. 13_2_20CM_53_11]